MPGGGHALDAASLVDIAANVAGGLAVQLIGISTISHALQQALGSSLSAAIRASCSHPVTAFATGAVATAALTSATATSMMVVEFLESGAMTFADSLPVALGINIGSTVAPLISRVLPLTRFGLAIVGLAYFARMLITTKPSLQPSQLNQQRDDCPPPHDPPPARPEKTKESDNVATRNAIAAAVSGKVPAGGIAWYWIATAFIGLGQLFLGMHLLSAAVSPLKAHEPFRELLLQLAGSPWQGIMCGAVLTLVVQSSTAAIAIAAELTASGTMPAELAIAIAVGSNVGTCATTLAAAQGKSAAATRFAIAYLFFKIAGAVAVLLVFPHFVQLCVAAAAASRAVPGPVGSALACSWSHTLFNLALAVAFLPFSRMLVGPLSWLVGAGKVTPVSDDVAAIGKPKPE